MRRKVRTFKASSYRLDDCTGVGISEYNGYNTLGIHSLYIPRRISNRDTFLTIVQHIQTNLNKGELAYLRLYRTQYKSGWAQPYPMFKVRHEYGAKSLTFKEPQQLADDAIRRRSSICEIFEGEGLPTYESAN